MPCGLITSFIRYLVFRYFYFIHQLSVSRCMENIEITYLCFGGRVRLADATDMFIY